MKEYEATFGSLTVCAGSNLYSPQIDPTKPYIVRCDGHHFSRFMRSFDKPNDERVHKAMLYTTHDLVRQFGVCL